jgi:protein-tyrosine phosphatase
VEKFAMIGRIDVHTHLLPGVDDGCKTVEESIQCARALVGAGYTHAFCTPHVWPQFPHNIPGKIARAVTELQKHYDQANVPLKLMSGGEINLLWCAKDFETAPLQQIVTYGLQGRYMLFDFWLDSADECRRYLFPVMRRLIGIGLKIILAHPERIGVFLREPQMLREFTDLGVLLQMNTWCLTERPDSPFYRTAAGLLTSGQYFLCGTDLHGIDGMAIRLAGLQIAERLVGSKAIQKLTVDNPQLLLEGLNLPEIASAARKTA